MYKDITTGVCVSGDNREQTFPKRSERDVASPSARLLGKTGKEVAISGRELEEETVFGAGTTCHQLVKHVSSSPGRELEKETVWSSR